MNDQLADDFFPDPRLFSLPTDRAAYSDRAAWLMSTLAELAYTRFEEDGGTALRSALGQGNFTLIGTYQKESETAATQAFLARNDQLAILAFRGTTADFKQILTDLNARFINTPDGKAHRGFLEAFKLIEAELKAAISNLPAGFPLYITGHSLGGALAVVAAKRLDDTRTVAACYTFGCPRVGTEEWDKKIKPPVYRAVNNADGVPAVPFSSMMKPLAKLLKNVGFFGYQHAGDLRYLNKAGQLKTGSAATVNRIAKLISSFALGIIRFDFRRLSFLVKDHKIAGYRSKLLEVAKEKNKPAGDA